MGIKDIAIKNLLRRKAKAAFILAGLIIGVATVVAVVSFADTMTKDINHKLEKYGANILIVPHTDNLSLTYGGMTLGGVSFEMEPIRQSELSQINTIKNAANLAAVGPIILGTVQIKSQAALLAGVDFKVTGILKPWWKIDGAAPVQDQLLAGAQAAKLLEIKIGQQLSINHRTMTVSGILAATGSQDDQLLFTTLSTAQAVLDKPDEVSLVEVAALCNACPVDDMVNQISAKLPNAKVMAIQQVVKGRMETLAQFRKFSYGLSVVVVFIGGLVVLVTLMGSVKERTKEIGIFRAIGFRQGDIMRVIFIESGLISIVAGVMGYLIGTGAIWAGLKISGKQGDIAMSFDPILATGAVAMALIVGLMASAYPAVMAARMDPNQALKSF
ncbi:MAG: FtsX-like permease family protein [Desulfobacteraceae bacterium]|jgi:putative ABC transport system permease protein